MRSIRYGWIVALVLGGVVGAPRPASAGIPVIDSANLAQAIQEVLAWGRQYTQTVSQLANQVTQIQRITGSRNLGQTYNNLSLQTVVPTNTTQVLSAVSTQGYNGLSPPAQSLRSSSMIYNCADRPVSVQASCQAPLSVNSQTQAWTNSGMTTVSGRVTEIQNMQQQVNGTTDPMAIAEVNAALQAETAQVANDQNRIALMRLQIEAQQQAISQQAKERELQQQVANSPSVADNIVFP